MIEYRPASGAGSCAQCRGELGLDAVKEAGVWYCCSSCAQGGAPDRSAAVAEPRLYHRPARHFRRRLPKELRGARPEAPASALGLQRTSSASK